MEKEEINKQIHEKIFGKKPQLEYEVVRADGKQGWCVPFVADNLEHAKEWCSGRGGRYKYETHEVYPNYSGDIAEAWKVVEKLSDHPAADISLKIIRQDVEPFWTVGFYGERSFYGTADTAPMAICKAALLAVSEGRL